MVIKWKVVATHPDQGSIEVLWYDDATGIELGPYNITIPLANGRYPHGAELKRIIDGYTPLGEFERLNAVKQAEGVATMAHIDALVGVEHAADLTVFVTQAQVQPDPVASVVTVVVD